MTAHQPHSPERLARWRMTFSYQNPALVRGQTGDELHGSERSTPAPDDTSDGRPIVWCSKTSYGAGENGFGRHPTTPKQLQRTPGGAFS